MMVRNLIYGCMALNSRTGQKSKILTLRVRNDLEFRFIVQQNLSIIIQKYSPSLVCCFCSVSICV